MLVTFQHTWAKLLPVAILVWATILGVPVYLFNVSAPFNASSPSAYAAMLAARDRDPSSLVFDERSVGGHPFVVSFSQLPCTHARCWYFTVNNESTGAPIDEARAGPGDVVEWRYLAL
jgi:hypothetical protein